VVLRKRTGVDPGADGHAAGEPECGGMAGVQIVLNAVENEGSAPHAGYVFRLIVKAALELMAGRIERNHTATLVELPVGLENPRRYHSSRIDTISGYCPYPT